MEKTKNQYLAEKIVEYYKSISFEKYKDTEIGLIEVLDSYSKQYDEKSKNEIKLVKNILGQNLEDVNLVINNSELTQAQRCCKDFFDIEKHIALFKEREHYREIIAEQSYDVGRKIWLELEVVDKEMSHFLFKWMYGKFEDIYNIPFGCKLHVISWVPPGGEVLKNKLIEFLNENFK